MPHGPTLRGADTTDSRAASRGATSIDRRPPRRDDRAPRIGQQLLLDITALTLEGEAVARHGEYVLFVPGAIPGEQVVAEVVSTGKRYGRARVVEVKHRSPARVEARCRHFGVCGSCSWQHIAYAEQLRWKERLLRETLEHALAGVMLPIMSMIGMPDPWGTRNKAQFIVGDDHGRVVLGHFRAHSREIVPLDECPVHHDAGNRIAGTMLRLVKDHDIRPFVEGGHGGIVRYAVVRVSGSSGEAQATLVATRPKFRGRDEFVKELVAADPSVTGAHLNINRTPGTLVMGPETERLAGHRRLIDEIGGIQYLMSPQSFFQTSSAGAARLVETVLRFVPDAAASGQLPPSCSILDLYAGVGLFALPLAARGHRVVAIEENAIAVEDGIAALKLNGISGCRFQTGKVETTLKHLARDAVHHGDDGRSFQVVILDPPRDGCPEWVLRLVARDLRPERIIDVSCDATALARDLVLLVRAGYRVREIQPIDMFPHTSHIESVALLERVERLSPAPRAARGSPARRFNKRPSDGHRPRRRDRIS